MHGHTCRYCQLDFNVAVKLSSSYKTKGYSPRKVCSVSQSELKEPFGTKQIQATSLLRKHTMLHYPLNWNPDSVLLEESFLYRRATNL